MTARSLSNEAAAAALAPAAGLQLLVYLLFLVSGACGLIYEIAWSRILTNVFGTTVLAVGTVLAAFMSGLALGSYTLGRAADRSRNPLRLYAWYEIGVGLSALAVLYLLDRTPAAYLALYELFSGSFPAIALSRFVAAFLLVMLPTLLMGATLPILSRFVIRRIQKVGSSLGTLYAINTVGAVAGCLLAGFWLIGTLGVHATVFVAVAGNILVGAVAWLASRRSSVPLVSRRAAAGSDREPAGGSEPAGSIGPATESEPTEQLERAPGVGPASGVVKPAAASADGGELPPGFERLGPRAAAAAPALRGERLLLWAFGISGFASFSYEIFWTRSLVFLLGNSTYAFTLMLTAFLSGIALGGYAVRLIVDRVESPQRLFGWIQILIGLTSAAALPLLFFIVGSERLRDMLFRMSGELNSLALSQFGVALIVMLVPATLIGTTFPLVGRIYVKDLGRTGGDTGKVYAVNTLGNVLGALAPGLVILPAIGIQSGVLLIAALNVSLGLVFVLPRARRLPALRFAASALLLVSALAAARYPSGFQFPSQYQLEHHEVLYYREGTAATTKVFRDPATGEKLMSVDGIVIGGSGITNYKQQLLAHLPKLLLESYSTELTIGLGSAILAGESARHDAIERIVCVEIEPSVIEGAGSFAEESFGVLDDPRLELVVDDAGHYLRTTSESFDIISADEKTADNYAANGFSYSADYYTLLATHLKPGGLVAQWVPIDLPPSQFEMVLRTFSSTFPYTALWYFPPAGKIAGGNAILIGATDGFEFDPARIERALSRSGPAFDSVRRFGLTDEAAVLAHFVTDGDALRRAVADARVNSMERPYYEFYSPADYAVAPEARAIANQDLVAALRGAEPDARLVRGLSGEARQRVRSAFAAEGTFLSAFRLQLTSGPSPTVDRLYSEALSTAPWNLNLRYQILPYYWNMAGERYLAFDDAGALAFMRRAVRVYGQDGEARYYLGLLLERNGRVVEAAEQYEQALALRPSLESARRALANLRGAGRGAAPGPPR